MKNGKEVHGNGHGRKPRALFLSISFDPEPGAIRGLPLATWLRDHAGYDVEVLTAIPWYPIGRFYPGYRFRIAQVEELNGVRVWRVPLIPSHDSSAPRRMLTYFSFMVSAILFGLPRVRKPDLIYYFDNLPTTGMVAWLLSKFTGARIVQHIADLWPEAVTQSGMIRPARLNHAIARAIEGWCRMLYRRQSHITVLSPEFKRVLLMRGVSEERVEIIYNWADETRFFPADRDSEMAARLGLSNRLNIVYAGNMGPLQSLETVVEAAALLSDLPHIQFVLAGGGTREVELQALAQRRAPNMFRFLGRLPLDEMNSLNALADGLLIHLKNDPAMRGTIPSKVQVSLASGRPLLLGANGDAAELVGRSGGGIIFEAENPESLAQAVRKLAAMTPAEREAMGRAGRSYYDREISLEVGARKTERVFRAALAQ